jgi:hypothetical protein
MVTGPPPGGKKNRLDAFSTAAQNRVQQGFDTKGDPAAPPRFIRGGEE